MTAEQPRDRLSLEAAAAAVSVPEGLGTLRDQPDPDLAAGQLWRADWDDDALLVAVVGIGGGVASVPVSFDEDYVDEHSVVLDASSTALRIPLVAWPALQRTLPMAVFGRFVGLIADPALTAIADPSTAQSAPTADNLLVQLYRAMIEDTIESLAASRWQLGGTGELTTILRSLSPAEIASMLGSTPQRALALWRGLAPLASDEATAIGPRVGRTVDELLAGNPSPPAALVESVEQPVRHRQIRAFAEQRELNLAPAYRDVAASVWALAARQTGTSQSIDWDGRLDTFFEAVLGGS